MFAFCPGSCSYQSQVHHLHLMVSCSRPAPHRDLVCLTTTVASCSHVVMGCPITKHCVFIRPPERAKDSLPNSVPFSPADGMALPQNPRGPRHDALTGACRVASSPTTDSSSRIQSAEPLGLRGRARGRAAGTVLDLLLSSFLLWVPLRSGSILSGSTGLGGGGSGHRHLPKFGICDILSFTVDGMSQYSLDHWTLKK